MRDASRIKYGVNKEKKKRVMDVLLIAMTMIVLSGCANPFSYYTNLPTPVPDRVDTGFVVTGPNSFDSADTAILVGRDE